MAERFYKVYDEVLADSELSYPEMILYGVIVRLSRNDEKRCFASNQALANIMRCSKSSISKWLDTLSRRGYIKRWVHYMEGTKHVDKRYITPVTIYPADLQEDMPQDGNRAFLSDRTRYTEELQEGILPDDKDSKRSLERENSKSNEGKELVRTKMLHSLHWLHFERKLNDTIEKWIDYRLSKNEPVDIERFREQLNLIKKVLDNYHSESEVISLIKECMAKGWNTIPFDMFRKTENSGNFFLNLVRQNRT